jgi:hypothetical protein
MIVFENAIIVFYSLILIQCEIIFFIFEIFALTNISIIHLTAYVDLLTFIVFV